jgi:hypothetical protein
MLRTDKDIFCVAPPFLILIPGGKWRLAAHVFPHPDGLCIVEPCPDSKPGARVFLGHPWHVADDVWELDYGVQIMTLRRDYYESHPAWARWQSWLSHPAASLLDRARARRLARACGARV